MSRNMNDNKTPQLNSNSISEEKVEAERIETKAVFPSINNNGSPLASNISPPGMKLRSGRKKRRHANAHHKNSTKRPRQSETEWKRNEEYTDGEESNDDYSRQLEIDSEMETEWDSKKGASMDGISEVDEHIYDERNGRDMDEPSGGKSSSNKVANIVQMNLPSEAPTSLNLRLPYGQTPVQSRQESNDVSPNIAYYGGSTRLRDFSTPAAPLNKASTSIVNQSSPPSQPNFATQRMSRVDIASNVEEEDTKSSHGIMQSSQVWICIILVVRFVLA